jgi:lysine 2,3-aminomutase
MKRTKGAAGPTMDATQAQDSPRLSETESGQAEDPHLPNPNFSPAFQPFGLGVSWGPLANGAFSNPLTVRFRERNFPNVTDDQWNDWTWQLKNRITGLAGLSRLVRLSTDEREAFQKATRKLPLSITPYYMSLIDPDDPAQPLRRCVIPTAAEELLGPGEAEDPLNEDGDSKVPGLVHRYPDRVLLLATGSCSVYCRYCTRHRMVAGRRDDCRYDRNRLERAFDYIRNHEEVRDVLISGGDPLLLTDERLEWILSRLRRIDHVELVRIGTKTPAVLPQRITESLVRMLRRYHPLFLSLHFTHPGELTPEARIACERLADGGIPLGSQTVLLKGVNDDVATLKALFHGLLKNRVRPYYLYQCDPIKGSAHFRTTVAKGLEIIQGLRGHTTGYAVPTYVIDAPGGGGKIAVYPETMLGHRGDNLVLRNYEGLTFAYPDPASDKDPVVH